MRQVLLREGRAVIEEVPRPSAEAGRVLVRTAYSVLSAGTERATLRATESAGLLGGARDPRLLRRAFEVLRDEGAAAVVERLKERQGGAAEAVPGYSAAGRVEEVGPGVADLPPGTEVACAGAGFAGHAEWIAVPRLLVAPVPRGVPLEEAAFTTLGAIALQGVRRAQIQVGETAVVLGLGLVGLLSAQIARAAGAEVLGFDTDGDRAARGRALGLEAFDLASRDPRDEIPRVTSGLLADAVLVCAASAGSEVTHLAMRLLRKKGRLVIVGDVGLDLDRSLLYEKEIDLLISTSYGPGRYDPQYEEKGIDYPAAYVRWTENRNMGAVLRLLAQGRVTVRPLIDHLLPLDEAPRAYELLSPKGPGERRPIGVLLRYPAAGPAGAAAPAASAPVGAPAILASPGAAGSPEDAGAAPAKSVIAARGEDAIEPVPGTAAIGVALCGAGSFVRAAHLPVLRRLDGFAVRSVVTGSPATARQAAQKSGAARAATRLADVLDDRETHLVLVGTRHHLHAAQAKEALHAGRHVLVEKPLCLDEADLAPLLEAARRARRLLAVGFNRRYSPLVRRAKEALRRLPGPALLAYRVNAGTLPAGHWALDREIGGGRILGECCHFVDLLLDLAGAPLAGLSARALPSDGARVVGGDSFAALLWFADGSRATLLYTGLGDPSLPKERVEIFKGGAAIVIDDFRALEVHGGLGGSLTLPKQDKGMAGQWEAIARRLRGEPSEVMTLAEIEASMRATFLLDRAVRGERCAS